MVEQTNNQTNINNGTDEKQSEYLTLGKYLHTRSWAPLENVSLDMHNNASQTTKNEMAIPSSNKSDTTIVSTIDNNHMN